MDQSSSRTKVRIYYIFIVFEIICLVLLVITLLNLNSSKHKTNNILIKDGLIYRSGESTPLTGKVLDTLDNKVILEYDVVNGIKEGQFFISTLEGKYTVFGSISANKNVGCWKYFYEDGQIQCSGCYDNDLPTGKWTWFYENGREMGEGLYLKGIKVGKWIEYDDTGYPISFILYQDDEVINKVEIHKPKMI